MRVIGQILAGKAYLPASDIHEPIIWAPDISCRFPCRSPFPITAVYYALLLSVFLLPGMIDIDI